MTKLADACVSDDFSKSGALDLNLFYFYWLISPSKCIPVPVPYVYWLPTGNRKVACMHTGSLQTTTMIVLLLLIDKKRVYLTADRQQIVPVRIADSNGSLIDSVTLPYARMLTSERYTGTLYRYSKFSQSYKPDCFLKKRNFKTDNFRILKK
jgi:hypothetical protein